jgi:hypothetical protein
MTLARAPEDRPTAKVPCDDGMEGADRILGATWQSDGRTGDGGTRSDGRLGSFYAPVGYYYSRPRVSRDTLRQGRPGEVFVPSSSPGVSRPFTPRR